MMVNAKQWTRSGLFFCGLLGLLITACVTLPGNSDRIAYAMGSEYLFTQTPAVLSLLVTPVLSIFVSWYLISKSNAIANRLLPDEEPTPGQVEVAMYRVALTAVAVLVFSDAIPQFLRVTGLVLINNYEQGAGFHLEQSFSIYNLPDLIAFFVQIGVATYLLFGAPQLVKWQMSRSKATSLKPFQFGTTHLIVVTVVGAIIAWIIAFL